MARLIANTANMPEIEWLQLRKSGIGGSDASAVAGVNKYSSPVMVYMDKLGLHNSDKPDNVKEAAHFGHVLEPVVRNEFKRRINAERAEKGQKPLRVVHRQAIFAHEKYDFMRTNLDGIVQDPELGQGVFEAKTSHYMLREDWDGEDVPNQYYIQCQHNMAVMGFNYAWLAVLIGGNTFKYYFIERDQDFIDHLITIEERFWNNHILQRIPPAMSGHKEEAAMLNGQYPQSEDREGYIVNLPNECIGMVERIDVYKQIITELETSKRAEENELKAIMGDTSIAFAGSHKVTWKTSTNGVKTLRLRLNNQDERNKFYEKMQKATDKEIKEAKKEYAEFEKLLEARRKADEKARKEAEKAAEKELKEAEKALKAAKKEAEAAAKEALKIEREAAKNAGEKVPKMPKIVAVEVEKVKEPLHSLLTEIASMYEDGENDLKDALTAVDRTISKIENEVIA